MDFDLSGPLAAFREEVRAFIHQEMTPELEEQIHRTGVSHDDRFVRQLAERGWVGGGWDRGDGTRPLNALELHVLEDELTRVGAPIYASTTTEMVAKVVRIVGSDELKAMVIPGFLKGALTIALGQTEPEAGSDIAGIRTKARRDGETWIIDGQKMFTTNAHVADYVFLLTRTRTDPPRHAGLTMFLVPLDTPGIQIQAVYTMSGERTNIVFLNDVVVEDRWRVGEVGGGWKALMLAMQDEHSAPFSPHLAHLMELVEEWARSNELLDEPRVRARLARWATQLEVAQLLEWRATTMEARGDVPVAEGPMSKLFATEALVRGAEDLTELVGPDALRAESDPASIAKGRIERALRFSLGPVTYAGTSEVQRNIIARQACDLPRH
ncbi:MAG TPA: acyl-CoA dehydrogenase family protein [Acidimicrobiales bacterium]|nr:acyl-CoA dehydrogenase family protein [Acidimicrobiales bacterium]